MSWTTNALAELTALGRKSGCIPRPGLRLMDAGSQDLVISSESERAHATQLLAQWTDAPGVLPASGPITPRDFFSAAGVDYWCLDIDERPGTLRVDLNTGRFPREYRNSFDFVCNLGTTEHVANPMMALFTLHHLTAPGGLLFHDVPINGFGNHGFLNFTPKFWHTIHWMNSYELLDATIRTVDESLADPNNFTPAFLSHFRGLDSLANKSAMIQIVFRKSGDHVFRPPLDMWAGMTRAQFRACAEAAVAAYPATGVVTAEEARNSIDDLVSWVGFDDAQAGA